MGQATFFKDGWLDFCCENINPETFDMKKIAFILFFSLMLFSCKKENELVNITTDAQVVGFVMEKCYCCWGWVIKIGADTIKAEQIPNLNLSENIVFPINAKITTGSKTIDCSNQTNDMTKMPDYYEIIEFIVIK